MREQYAALAELATLENVTLQVLPQVTNSYVAFHALEGMYRGEVRLTSVLPTGAPVPRLLWSCLPGSGPDWVLLSLEDLPGAHPDLSATSGEAAELVALWESLRQR